MLPCSQPQSISALWLAGTPAEGGRLSWGSGVCGRAGRVVEPGGQVRRHGERAAAATHAAADGPDQSHQPAHHHAHRRLHAHRVQPTGNSYSAPIAERSIVMNVSVCLSVCACVFVCPR